MSKEVGSAACAVAAAMLGMAQTRVVNSLASANMAKGGLERLHLGKCWHRAFTAQLQHAVAECSCNSSVSPGVCS